MFNDFVDEYVHDVPGVMYFPRSLPTKEVENLYEDILQGCNCETSCSIDKHCACINKSGTNYTYENVSNLYSYSIHESRRENPTYECNEFCKCKEQICGNKLVQFGPRKGLKVKLCDDKKGLGLYSEQKIKEGNFVCEYAGEIIIEQEAMRRFKNYSSQNKMNYIFCIKEHFGTNVTKTFIDPSHYGNIGRYINHSCEPNCKLFVVRIDNEMPILGIFASEDIDENIEITYDYGEESHSFGEGVRKSCYCGSQHCRKYLPFDLSLS